MNVKRFVVGTIVGGIIMFAVGYLFFDLAFGSFYEANSEPGVMREAPLVWPILLASLSYAAFITLAIGSRTGATSVAAGVKVGAVIGFLLWFTADFGLYGNLNIANLTLIVVDSLLELVRGGIVGGVLAASIGKIQ